MLFRSEWLDHIEYLLDKFDSYHWGQTYWCYYDGLLENPIMRDLVRTSPVAVTGDIESYSFDRKNEIFTLVYNQDKEYDEPTEIYMHKEPKKVTASGEYEIDGRYLRLKTAPGRNEIKIEY